MLHFVQHDKPGRSLVIVDGTAVTQHHMWLLPSPARARRACPLPGQRLSIFSILGPERAKKLSIGVHGFEEKQRKSTASGQGKGSGKGIGTSARFFEVSQGPAMEPGLEPAAARRRFASFTTSSGSGPLRAAAILSRKWPTSRVPTIVVSRSGLERVKRRVNSERLAPPSRSSRRAFCHRSRSAVPGSM